MERYMWVCDYGTIDLPECLKQLPITKQGQLDKRYRGAYENQRILEEFCEYVNEQMAIGNDLDGCAWRFERRRKG